MGSRHPARRLTRLFLVSLLAIATGVAATILWEGYSRELNTLWISEIAQVIFSIVDIAVFTVAAIAVLFIVYGGYLYISSSGDPQRVGQARTTVLCAFGGLILVGMSYVIPRIISDYVIQPAGGAEFISADISNCDQILKNRLVVTPGLRGEGDFNSVIQIVKGRYPDCQEEGAWNPKAKDWTSGAQSLLNTNRFKDCEGVVVTGTPPYPATHWPIDIPIGIRKIDDRGYSHNTFSGSVVKERLHLPSLRSIRSAEGNIHVRFDPDHRPWDGAVCWVYSSRYGMWFSANS